MATMYTVEMADGRQLTVGIDQRDWAAMEALEFPVKATTLQTRHMCWTALRRDGVRDIPDWPRFNEHDCISVQLAAAGDESDGEDEQRLNPGRTTPNGDGGSSSRSRRGNRSPQAASSTGTTGT